MAKKTKRAASNHPWRKDKEAAIAAALPPPDPSPQPASLPPVVNTAKRYTMTELAAITGVTEQTIRRWWLANLIPEPERIGRGLYWSVEVGNKIAETYRMTGAP